MATFGMRTEEEIRKFIDEYRGKIGISLALQIECPCCGSKIDVWSEQPSKGKIELKIHNCTLIPEVLNDKEEK
jgi:hypothetical protein